MRQSVNQMYNNQIMAKLVLFFQCSLIVAFGQLAAGRAEREVHCQDRERLLAERRGEDEDQAAGQDARTLRRAVQRRHTLR